MILLNVLVVSFWVAAERSVNGGSALWINVTKDVNTECNTTQTVEDVEIIWDVQQEPPYYAARPHCLDSKNMYVLKECPSCDDTKEMSCATTQKSINDCPDGYKSIENYCVKILPKDTYDNSKCDFEYTVTFPMKILMLNDSVWMPLKRNRDYGIGEFELDGVFIESEYNIKISTLEYNTNTNIDTDCLVYNYHDDTFEAVRCDQKYKRICAYEKLHIGSYRYCNLMKESCVNQEFDHKIGKCFCYECTYPKCSLAEMKIPYQSKILFEDKALLGLKYDDELAWISDEEKVNYTNWAYSNLIPPDENYFVTYTSKGWILEVDKPTCKICDMTFTFFNPVFEIVTITKYIIVVTAKNVDGFVMNGKYYINCYTDSHKYTLVSYFDTIEEGVNGTFTMYPSLSGNYWCEGHRLEDFNKVSTRKVFITLDNIYVIEIDLTYETWENPTSSKTASGYIDKFNEFILKKIGIKSDVKWMKTLRINEDEFIVTYLLHICVDIKENHTEIFWKIKKSLDGINDWPTWIIKTSPLYNSEFCVKDVTYYHSLNITWPQTPANTSTNSIEMCLDLNGFPIFRNCIKDHLEGARWDSVENCSARSENKSEVSDELLELLESGTNNEKMIDCVIQLTHKADLLLPIDVYIVSKIFEKFLNHSIDLFKLTKTVSNILALKKNILDTSQIEMNATDRILYNFDKLLINNQANYAGTLIESRNLYVLPFNPKTNIIGLALLNIADTYRIVEVLKGTTLEEVLIIPNLEAAVILPDELLHSISSEVSLSVFLTDNLFAGTSHENKVLGKNIAVLLPEIRNVTEIEILILIKPNVKLTRRIRKCAFWKYGSNKGYWSLESEPDRTDLNFLLCKYEHATHFALLISDRISEYDETLDIITYVGFSFSIFGILGIFLTAILFKNWRQHDGNKVIIHYGAVSILQIIFLHISYENQEYYNRNSCIFVGAVLHYTVLCQFLWMLNMAFFMYKRYVQVLYGPKVWVFRKACLFQNEECNINDLENGVIWNRSQNNGKIASSPICLNEENIYILKECKNGILEDTNETCFKTQKPISFCPDDLIEFNDFCIAILDKTSYDQAKCPYGYDRGIPLDIGKPIWLNMRRNYEYGIGEFELDGIFDLNISNFNWNYNGRKFFGSDCLVYHNKSFIEAVDCSSKYNKICVYDRLKQESYRFCKFLDYPCVNPFYDHRIKKCYCLVDIDYTQFEYAQLVDPYQSSIILEADVLLGLTYNNGSLIWKSSGEEVEYTFWAPHNLIDFTENTSIILTDEGWITDGEVNLKLVAINYSHGTPSISILLDSDGNIIITASNSEGFLYNTNLEYVFCFTDGNLEKLISKIFTMKYNDTTYRYKPINSGTYWCEGYSLDSLEKIISNKIFVRLENIYFMEFTIQYDKEEDPTLNIVALKYTLLLRKHVLEETGILFEIKWMKTLRINEVQHWVVYLFHICTDLSNDHLQEFFRLQKMFMSLNWPHWVVDFSHFYNSKYCAMEIVNLNKNFISWPLTAANQIVRSVDICTDEDGHHIHRKCGFNLLEGVRWEEFSECYASYYDKSDFTEKLAKIIESNTAGNETVEKMLNFTSDPTKLKPVDVFLIAAVLKKLRHPNLDLEKVALVVSNVINVNVSYLNNSQFKTRATDKILQNFDSILHLNKGRYVGKLIETDNFAVFIFCPKSTLFAGLGLIRYAEKFAYVQFTRNTSFLKVTTLPELVAAIVLPKYLLDGIATLKDSIITLSLFLNDKLLLGPRDNKENFGKNVGILLPDISHLNITYQIPVLFRPDGNLKRRDRYCGIWNYGKNFSFWDLRQPPDQTYPDLKVCFFVETGYFGFLLLDRLCKYSNILDTVTFIGCGLSLVGFAGIFITACLFKGWRSYVGNKVIIHYSLISTLQITLFFVSYQLQENFEKIACIAVGTLLFYTILCQLVWILIIALFMYRRYVIAMHCGEKIPYEKSYLISYITPIFIIIPQLFFKNSYVEGKLGICYISGPALRYLVALPVSLIIVINIFIFLVILFELSCKQNRSVSADDSFILKLRLTFLVFFITAMTCIFSLLFQFFDSVFLQFSFCATTSLQGFILFLFFIVFNADTRELYRNLWNKCHK